MPLREVTPTALIPIAAGTFAAGDRRVVIDVGTGDASYAYRLARRRPSDLIIGLDPVCANLRAAALRASRKPERGGLPNLRLVCGSAEDLADSPLVGLADEVTVLLPWGRLLAGILTEDAEVQAGLAAIGRPGTTYEFVLNGEIWIERMPRDHSALPDPTPEFIELHVVPRFQDVGIEIVETRELRPDECRALDSTWAKRLHHGRSSPRFVLVRGVRRSAASRTKS